jgi:phospholipase/carboxylesterase
MLPLGRSLDPAALLLAPTGNEPEAGAARWFRRFAEGVFDLENLHFRATELGTFVAAAKEQIGFAEAETVAVGFSNGANIASAAWFHRPDAFDRAVIVAGMVPFDPDPPPNLGGKRVLLVNARNDPMVPTANAERLAEIYRLAGAQVEHLWHEAGHRLTREIVESARDWIQGAGPVNADSSR